MDFYLVTGGAGFIGSNIALRLASMGRRVRVLDNFSHGLSRNQIEPLFRKFGNRVEIVDADVRDLASCISAMQGITHVLHHAGISSATYSIEDPGTTISVNVLGTSNLLLAARDSGSVARFVNASSCAIYGDGPSSAKTESAMLHPGTVFATSMQASESLCENFFRTYKFCAGSLRYFNVYGESEFTTGRVRSAVAKIVDAALRGDEIMINGRGQQTRDFIHIDDAVNAALLVCECDERFYGGQTYNVGTGVRTSILDLVDLIQTETGHSYECVACQLSPHALLHSRADMVKANALLKFQAKVTIEQGIERLVHLRHSERKAA